MTIQQLIDHLRAIQEQHGDIDVSMHHDLLGSTDLTTIQVRDTIYGPKAGTKFALLDFA